MGRGILLVVGKVMKRGLSVPLAPLRRHKARSESRCTLQVFSLQAIPSGTVPLLYFPKQFSHLREVGKCGPDNRGCFGRALHGRFESSFRGERLLLICDRRARAMNEGRELKRILAAKWLNEGRFRRRLK